MNPDELAERVRARCPDTIVARGDVSTIVDRDDLLETLAWVRDDPDLSLDFCCSVTATDWPGSDPRLWVAYELRSKLLTVLPFPLPDTRRVIGITCRADSLASPGARIVMEEITRRCATMD